MFLDANPAAEKAFFRAAAAVMLAVPLLARGDSIERLSVDADHGVEITSSAPHGDRALDRLMHRADAEFLRHFPDRDDHYIVTVAVEPDGSVLARAHALARRAVRASSAWPPPGKPPVMPGPPDAASRAATWRIVSYVDTANGYSRVTRYRRFEDAWRLILDRVDYEGAMPAPAS